MYNQHTVFQFGGREFVSGLFWQTVSSAKEWRKEARAQAEVQFKDMDLVTFCQLKDTYGVPQIGFASEEGGGKKGAISIAAAIGKAVAERHNHSNWIGIFPVDDDVYIFVAVVKDALLPEGDLAGSKSDVLQRFGQEFSQTNQWDAIFAPKSFQIGRAEELTLTELLPFKGASVSVKDACRLGTVRGGVTRTTAILGMLALVSAAVAYFTLTRDIEPPKIEIPEVSQIIEPTKKEPKRIMLPLPWITQPEPAQVALMCLDAIQKTSASPGGWELDTVLCGQAGVKFIWKRGASNVKFIMDAIPDVKFEPASDAPPAPGQVAMPNGDRASYTIGRTLPPPGEGEAISVMTEGRLALLSIVQSTGLQGTFQDFPESETKNAAGDIEIKTWKNLTFSLTGRLAPWDFVSMASHIHGLRLTRATFAADQWKLDGDIYGK